MDSSEMEGRRQAALEALQDAVDELGPITDQTRHAIREPVLDAIDDIYEAGNELKALDFEIYDESSEG